MQKIDNTLKPIKKFETELDSFAKFIIRTKKKYFDIFNEESLTVDIPLVLSLFRPWIEEQLETLMRVISKYMGKLKSSQNGKEYNTVLRNAMNEFDRQGISISYKVGKYCSCIVGNHCNLFLFLTPFQTTTSTAMTCSPWRGRKKTIC